MSQFSNILECEKNVSDARKHLQIAQDNLHKTTDDLTQELGKNLTFICTNWTDYSIVTDEVVAIVKKSAGLPESPCRVANQKDLTTPGSKFFNMLSRNMLKVHSLKNLFTFTENDTLHIMTIVSGKWLKVHDILEVKIDRITQFKSFADQLPQFADFTLKHEECENRGPSEYILTKKISETSQLVMTAQLSRGKFEYFIWEETVTPVDVSSRGTR